MTNFVILCGGSGSRLFPKSREKLPKQLLELTNEFTMLQNTLLRINHLIKKSIQEKSIFSEKDKIYIVCNKDHSHIVSHSVNEMKDLNNSITIVSEPKGRDSAPAICISSLLGKTDDFTFVLPCDHVFDDEEFAKCCIQSIPYLESSVVTFGIKPTQVETGYGYIQMDTDTKDTLQFIEKPNLEKATKYFEDGNYLWNAGIFAFKNETMIRCFEKYAVDILNVCKNTIENTAFTNDQNVELSSTPFVDCRAISVDYAIMEFLCKDESTDVSRKTIEYNSYWNDIGSFAALYQQLEKDENGNVSRGEVMTIDTKNSYIESSENSFSAVIGLNDIIVVNTEDALLVCSMDKCQKVKNIVEELKKKGRDEVLFHKKVFRPWGYYKNIEGNDYSHYKMKKIVVYPGKKLSLQSHEHRSEHWVITKGNAKVQVGEQFYLMGKDEHVYIPIQTLHRIENVGEEDLEFTETQIGDYLGEDDIIRYEDDFGRV
jgi:mannose-1-phosphate guanylyltransferase/mannose-6-phosphate isomerase